MTITLDWLGTATFRLTIDDLVVFLDAYFDRSPAAPPVGLRTAEVDRADFTLVGHSHFDHLAGAEVIARNTGATIIASNESCRIMRECGVPAREQLRPSQGGERHRLADGVTVRVFPSLHACLWAGPPGGIGEEQTGGLGLCEDERRELLTDRNPVAAATRQASDRAQQFLEHVRGLPGSTRDGGPLAYLIETPQGSIFYQDTSGCWSGVLRDLRADVAILALSGRPNVDGEPFQGSLAQFVAREAAWLQPRTVLFGHHDNWTGMAENDVIDTSPARREVEAAVPGVTLLEPGYLEGTELLAG
jgi:L-ascorbate metabolism protein UlaG (beta-lactamase superfamily)